MTTTYNRFEEAVANKLGEIQTKDTPFSAHIDSVMSSAVPIWVLLGITEEEYNIKYCPVQPEQEQISNLNTTSDDVYIE